jgi:ABC-type Fe3+ transport system permease subunit
MWWVYVPAIVVEGKGIIGAFGRSRELTRGRRWHLLGLLVIVVILSILVGVVVQLIAGVILMSSTDGSGWTIFNILQYVFTSLVTAFNAVLVAVGYYYLRAEKEGVDVNEIARIFD